jgi:hypothetical protein
MRFGVVKRRSVLATTAIRSQPQLHGVPLKQTIYGVHGILTVRHDKTFFEYTSTDSKCPHRELPFTPKFRKELCDFVFASPLEVFRITQLRGELVTNDFFIEAWHHYGSSARSR